MGRHGGATNITAMDCPKHIREVLGPMAKKRELPPPSLLAALICDQVIRDRTTLKPSLIGVFTDIHASKFPAVHPRMTLFFQLTNGHGKIGFLISEGTKEAVIPSIPGHSFNLPNDFFIIQEHQASSFDTAGAYMPPCSGGIGNSYYVTVKAVMLISEEDKTYTLLGQGILELGKY